MPPTFPLVAKIRATALTQYHPASCGAAVGARILTSMPGVTTAEQVLEQRLFEDLSGRYPRRHPKTPPSPVVANDDDTDDSLPNEPRPPMGEWGHWGCAPRQLAEALNSQLLQLTGAGAYKVFNAHVKNFDTEPSRADARTKLLEAMLASIGANWPAPVIIHRGAHWVLAYRYRVDTGTATGPYADLEVISPQFGGAPSAPQIVDVQSTLADPLWFKLPIGGGAIYSHDFVALVADQAKIGALPSSIFAPLPGGAVQPIAAVQAQRAADTLPAIKRFALLDPNWLALAGAPLGTPVRIERLTPGARPFDLVPILGAEPGTVRGVVLFDTITGRVAEGARFDTPLRIQYDSGRRLVWQLCLESTQTWLAFYDDGGGILGRVDGERFSVLTPLRPGW